MPKPVCEYAPPVPPSQPRRSLSQPERRVMAAFAALGPGLHKLRDILPASGYRSFSTIHSALHGLAALGLVRVTPAGFCRGPDVVVSAKGYVGVVVQRYGAGEDREEASA